MRNTLQYQVVVYFITIMKRINILRSKFAILFLLVVNNFVVCAQSSFISDNSKEMKELLHLIEKIKNFDIKQSFELAKQAELLLPQEHNYKFEIQIYSVIAYYLLMSNDFTQAYRYINKTKKSAAAINSMLDLAKAYKVEGAILFKTGLHSEGLEAVGKSLEIYRQIDFSDVFAILHTISDYYKDIENYDKYLEYGKLLLNDPQSQAVDMYKGVGEYVIGDALLKLGRYKEARTYLQKAFDLLIIQDTIYISEVYVTLAELEFNENKIQLAMDLLAKSEELATSNNYDYAFVQTQTLKADIFQSQGDTLQAILILEDLVSYGLDNNIKKIQQSAYFELADIFEQVNDFLQALTYQKKYQSITEQIFNETQETKVALYQTSLETEQKEQQIKQLTADNAFKDLKTTQLEKTSELRGYIILLGQALLLTLLAFIIRAFYTKRKLTQLAQKAESANEAKSQFLAKMSHEIRTPMNAIIGLSHLILRTPLKTEQQANLNIVLSSAESLMALLNDILDFSKIEAKKLVLEHHGFTLDFALQHVENVCGYAIKQKQLEFIVDIDNNVPKAFIGDALRLQQVLINLVSNATKFTDIGTIKIKVKQIKFDADEIAAKNNQQHILGYEDKTVREIKLQFSVTDTGKGMSEQQQAHLFNCFEQADESITRKYGGTGLGLAISKELVELMQGRIWLTSEVGKGSIFRFDIVLEQSDLYSVQVERAQIASLAKLKVLVVDDLLMARKLLVNTLSSLGIKAVSVDSGVKALQAVMKAEEDSSPFDVIVIDWKMPELNGIDAAKLIQQAVKGKLPHIILVSAFDIDQARKLAQDVIIDQYLDKPINKSNLLSVLSRIVQKREFEPLEQTLEIIPSVDEDVTDGKINNEVNSENLSSNANRYNVPDFSAVKILLVEDNELNQHVIQAFLADSHAQVEIAENGAVALNKLKEKTFDIIFMDVQMPVMDGLTAAKEIRETLKLNLPIIAMTAHTMMEDIEKSLSSGMNIHLTKPINHELMFDTIRELLKIDVNEDNKEFITNKGSTSVSTALVVDVQSPALTQCLALLSKDKSVEQQINALTKHTCLLVEPAIESLQNKASLYLELVKVFYKKKRHLSAELLCLYENGEFSDIFLIAHAMKANAQYIGAYSLADACNSLEHAVNNDTNIKVCLDPLISLLNRLLQELSPILTITETLKPIDETKEFNFIDAKKLINEMKLLLQCADVTSEDVSHQFLDLAKGTKHQDEILLLHHLICDYEFDLALKELLAFEESYN